MCFESAIYYTNIASVICMDIDNSKNNNKKRLTVGFSNKRWVRNALIVMLGDIVSLCEQMGGSK